MIALRFYRLTPCSGRGTLLAIPLTQAAVGAVSQRFNACVREMTFHAYTAYSRYSDAEPPPLAGSDRWPGFGPRCVHQCQGPGDHQGWRPALALRHHGHQRNHAEGYGPIPD